MTSQTPPMPGNPAPPRAEHPEGSEHPPKKKRRAGVIIGIVAAVVLVPVLAFGALALWAWWDHYVKFDMVHDKPNADRLTSMPTGEAPPVIDRLVWSPLAEFDDYTAWDHSGIMFERQGELYWDSRVRGGTWEARGDLLCEAPTYAGAGSFCVMAFTDGALVVQADEALTGDVEALTAEYLAGLAGEPTETNWFDATPPNVGDLPALAGLADAMPDVIGPEYIEQPRLGADGPTDLTHWRIGYGSEQLLATVYTAYTDHRLWGYYTSAPGLRQIDDALCSDEGAYATCVLAGSDGMLVITSPTETAEDIVAPLTAILG